MEKQIPSVYDKHKIEVFMIDSRVCTCCNIEKPFTQFGNTKKGKWGKREQCKDCLRIKNREYYHRKPEICHAKHKRWVNKNKEHVREYSRKRYSKDPEKYCQSVKDYRKKTKNKTIYDYRKRNPEKKQAHTYVELSIKYGFLKRPDKCSECDVLGKIDAHHEDYNKPLDVIWLCRKCHAKRHRIDFQPERLNEETSKEEVIV
jgi:Bacillus phage endonuclease